MSEGEQCRPACFAGLEQLQCILKFVRVDQYRIERVAQRGGNGSFEFGRHVEHRAQCAAGAVELCRTRRIEQVTRTFGVSRQRLFGLLEHLDLRFQTRMLRLFLCASFESRAAFVFKTVHFGAFRKGFVFQLLQGKACLLARLARRFVLRRGFFGLLSGRCNRTLRLRDLLSLRFDTRLQFVETGVIFGALLCKRFDLVSDGTDLFFDARALRLAVLQGSLSLGRLQLGFVIFALRLGHIAFGLLVTFAREMQFVHRMFLVGKDGRLLRGQRTPAFFQNGEFPAEGFALGMQFGGFTMPLVQIGSQPRKPFAEIGISRLSFFIRLFRFVKPHFLCADGIARVGQVALSAVPVKAIPFAQDQFQIRLSAGEVNGAFRLPFQTADARFEFGHDIQHAFKVALGIVESF